MGFTECCSSFFAGLPNPQLAFLPSFILGILFSAFFLIFVYKKKTKLPMKDIIVDIVKSLFCVFPSHEEHSESITCRSPNCVRCKKYEELEVKLVQKFDELKTKNAKLYSSRVEDSVRAIKEKRHAATNSKIDTELKVKNRRSSSQKPTIFYMDLAANPYWDDFDVYTMEIELLKLNFKIIMKEFEEIFEDLQNGKNLGWKLNDIPSGHWCIFPFIDQGIVNDANCTRCPNTSTMLGSIPSVMKDCVFGNACFSILYPDSYIEPHHGPTNLRLRCHLGLNIPNGCWLEVAGKQYKWKAQQAVVFDDSFEHSATFVKQSSSAEAVPRAILMMDFWHPDVTADEKKVLLELLAP